MGDIEVVKKLRDACNAILEAYDSKDENKLHSALLKFALLMVEIESLK